MKVSIKGIVTLVLPILCLSFSVSAKNKVVYGDDNRVEPFETSSSYFQLAESTAAMIEASNIQLSRSGTYDINTKTLADSWDVCKSERFSEQPTVAVCSGFLIAPDILVTAGHCITNQTQCDENLWVFNYGLYSANQDVTRAKISDVYKCKEILDRALDSGSDPKDYAVIRLERVVEGRTPLKFRRSGKIKNHEDVLVIGHPTGLPTKVADGASVRDNTHHAFFSTNLDTFGGNSGSAVFNTNTGEVEGILVRGEIDYVNDRAQDCKVVNVCEASGCRGEDVTRITAIPKLIEFVPVK